MATQVPRVQRIGPQETPSVGRIDVNVVNTNQLAAPMLDATSDAVSAAVKYYEKSEEVIADTKAAEIANTYERERASTLSNLMNLQGDTTEAYARFQDEGDQLLNEILERNNNYSDKVKNKIAQKVTGVNQEYWLKSTMAYGRQNAKYIEDVTEDSVSLLKDRLVDKASVLDFSDAATVEDFNKNLMAIVQERYNSAEKLNIPRETMNVKIAEDISSALKNVTEIMNASNRPDLAEKTVEKWGGFLDSVTKPKVIKDIEDTKVKTDAMAIVAEARVKAVTDIDAFLTEKTQDERVRQEALKVIEVEKGRMKRIADQVEYGTYSKEYKRVMDRMGTPEAYVSVAELEMDPDYQIAIKSIQKPEYIKNIRNLIKPPTDSDPGASMELIDRLTTGTLDMSTQEIQELMGRLNKTDQTRFFNLVKSDRTDPEGGRRAELGQARNIVNILFDKTPGVVKKKRDGFTWNDASKELYKEFWFGDGQGNPGFGSVISTLPKRTSPGEIEVMAAKEFQNFVDRKGINKTKTLWQSVTELLGGGSKTPEKVKTPPPVKPSGVEEPKKSVETPKTSSSTKSNKEWLEMYRNENGGNLPTSEQLKAFKLKKSGQ